MSFRSFRALALLCCATLAACGDGSGILGSAGSTEAARVRFVNASASPLDLAVNGTVPATNANISPGSSVGCFAVPDPTVPGLSVRQSGSTTDLGGFAPLFSSGGRYTVVAYPGPSGLIQFAGIPNASIPISGRSALRVFNGYPHSAPWTSTSRLPALRSARRTCLAWASARPPALSA